MELELKRNVMQCYDVMLDTTLCQEETQEAIVPDACPDIADILSVCGQICLGETQINDGQITVTGHVETVVLYRPDSGQTLQKLTLRLPFRTPATGENQSPSNQVFVHPTFCHGEARTLNPRKILVRVELMLDITSYGASSTLLCCGVENAEPQGVAQRITTQQVHPLCSVQVKHFTFDEAVTLQGQGEVDQILTLRILPNCTESKLIGNKLIFKGDTEIQIMYQETDGTLAHSRHQLPFSQIMEMEDLGEGSTTAVSLVVESYYISPTYDGNPTVDLTIDLIAQATVRGEKHLTLLEDAYSISHQMSIEKEPITLVTLAEEFVLPQPLRQIFETDTPIQRVEDSWASPGKITQTQEGNQCTFGCDVTLSLLCTGENGELQRLEFTQPISHTVDCPPDAICFCRCSLPGEVFATVAPGGVEIRLTPQFTYSVVQSQPMWVVSATQIGEPRDRTQASVVLRLPQEGESLWDIAKNYGTTTVQIVQANQLEEEHLPIGQMLLIPSVR